MTILYGDEVMFAFRSSHVVALAAALACSACQAGGWHLTGTNDVNLGAMVADPMDLVSPLVACLVPFMLLLTKSIQERGLRSYSLPSHSS